MYLCWNNWILFVFKGPITKPPTLPSHPSFSPLICMLWIVVSHTLSVFLSLSLSLLSPFLCSLIVILFITHTHNHQHLQYKFSFLVDLNTFFASSKIWVLIFFLFDSSAANASDGFELLYLGFLSFNVFALFSFLECDWWSLLMSEIRVL